MVELRYNLRAGLNNDSPVAYLVHGRSGNITVMSTFSRVLPSDWALVSVEAPFVDPNGGYSWWDIHAESKMEQRAASYLQLRNLVATWAQSQGLAPKFQLALGFSQGAAMLSLLIQREPELLQAVGLLSGFVLKEESVQAGKRPAVFMAHGSRDEIIPIDRAQAGATHLIEHGYFVEQVGEDVGHKVGVQGMRALRDWAAGVAKTD